VGFAFEFAFERIYKFEFAFDECEFLPASSHHYFFPLINCHLQCWHRWL